LLLINDKQSAILIKVNRFGLGFVVNSYIVRVIRKVEVYN